jgi:hypothetical protein
MDEKDDVAQIENTFTNTSSQAGEVSSEQDWTPEEERAVV